IPVSSDYIIGPGDEVHVQLYGKMNLSVDLLVDRDGMVSFPELGPITVAGLTFREMKETLYREVENRMIGVNIGVSMGRLRSIRIFALGDVFRPGSYTVSGLSTLTNALFSCGGVRKIGSLRRIQLKRSGKTIREMDLYDLILRGDTSDDVRLMPNDVIFAPTVGPLAGVAGEVLRPAVYEMKGDLTVRGLIDLAGGVRPTAFKDLIQVERIGDTGPVTYDMTLDESANWTLHGGDLVKVYPVVLGAEQAVFVEGNVVRPGKRQYSDDMRLLDLVSSPDDLLPETFFEYGLIERESGLDREPEYVAFDLGAALLDSVPEANLVLKARDKVFVFHRAHFRDVPRVAVRGEIRAAGSYEHKKDMRVLDLVLAAGGLTRDAWLDEAELFRTDPRTMDVERIPIDIARVLDGNESENIVLHDMDELAVHSVWEFKEKDTVQVLGEVNDPGTFPLSRGMRVSDLIFAGGNLKEAAYTREAELTRYEVIDGERRELRHMVVLLGDALSGSAEANTLLEPYDRLLVRRITNWRGDEVVQVSGEVVFPGRYPIEGGERLSNVIERFGGFLDDAYLEAASFQREGIRELQQEQLTRLADQLEADLSRLSVPSTRAASAYEDDKRQTALEGGAQLLTELRQTVATGRMVIRLDAANALRGTDDDIVLTDGDRLYVPKKPDFVVVMGQVSNPTAFHHERGKHASYYIDLAGGFTRFADSGATYVAKADGSVDRGRRSRIEPGDTVIVPESLDRFAGMQFLIDISQVLYQLGVAAASAHTIWGR
ncbi:MAG: SLBB domain-containing protein, partial [Candidatus Eisenbacteria sp.]|nr:SLBB domain-containing protein [Candidatus Eisenbacteria bacterium]